MAAPSSAASSSSITSLVPSSTSRSSSSRPPLWNVFVLFLMNIAVVFCGCSLLTFACILILPSRASAVAEYNRRVVDWQQKFSESFRGATFAVGGVNMTVTTLASRDELHDTGADLAEYETAVFTGQITLPYDVYDANISITSAAAPIFAANVARERARERPCSDTICVDRKILRLICVRVRAADDGRTWMTVDRDGARTMNMTADDVGCVYGARRTRYGAPQWTVARYENALTATQTQTRRRLLSLSSSSSSELVSSSSAPAVVPAVVTVAVAVRHFADPFLFAVESTDDALWFGLSTTSLVYLAAALGIVGVSVGIPSVSASSSLCCQRSERINAVESAGTENVRRGAAKKVRGRVYLNVNDNES